jgi:hypothetical protein
MLVVAQDYFQNPIAVALGEEEALGIVALCTGLSAVL